MYSDVLSEGQKRLLLANKILKSSFFSILSHIKLLTVCIRSSQRKYLHTCCMSYSDKIKFMNTIREQTLLRFEIDI